MKSADDSGQNLTIRLNRQTLRKAKILAAKHNLSISRLIARYIETLVGEDDAYERAHRQALALLENGFHLGGKIEATRDEWHER
jgi:predicted DNA-binding ribbon-helix-helix protein